ncbi:MAG TPA: hypothetical protein VKV74_00760, partial [Bryobacteraceae bacterium]|nr:hypothetical protein [Bryobacteraceae bacterium]
MEVTVVASAGRIVQRAGDPNPFCAGLSPRPETEGEEAVRIPNRRACWFSSANSRSRGLEDLWQLHFSVAGGSEANSA